MRKYAKKLLAGITALTLVFSCSGNVLAMDDTPDTEVLGQVLDTEADGEEAIGPEEASFTSEDAAEENISAESEEESGEAGDLEETEDQEDAAAAADDDENAETAVTLDSAETEEAAAEELLGATPVASGYCGAEDSGLESVTWTVTGSPSNYTLTISGEGNMAGYNGEDSGTPDVPWAEYRDGLTKIVVESGVASIGYNAFEKSTNVTSVSLPETVTSIGSGVFFECESLKSITVPSQVTRIRYDTFLHCTSLERVSLPDGITNIGDDAFARCTSLKSIDLPEELTQIGNEAFKMCAFQEIVLPENLRKIGDSAFSSCPNLSKVTFPSRLTKLGKNAFDSCENLSGTLVVPPGLTEIPISAFRRCKKLGSVVLPDGITKIGSNAFADCVALKSINIPSTVTTMGQSVFTSCEKLQEIEIPEGVTEIKWMTFSCCFALSRVTIPSTVTTIEEDAFYGAGTLDDSERYIPYVYYGGSETTWASISIGEGNESLLNSTIHYARDPENVITPTMIMPTNGETAASIVDAGNTRKFELKLTSDEEIESFDVKRGTIHIHKYSTGEKVWELKGNSLATLKDNVFSLTILTGELDYNTKYYIVIDSDFFWLSDKEKCLGTVGKDSWTFTTQLSRNMKRITLDPQGGSVSTTTLITNDDGKLESLPTPSISDGRTFGVWLTGPSVGDKVDTSYVFTQDTTIYAQYYKKNELGYDDMSPITNKISYNPDGALYSAFLQNLSLGSKKDVVIAAATKMRGKSGNFCFGSSCSIVAAKNGSLNCRDYGANKYHDLDFTRGDVREIMSVYQLQQYTNTYSNEQKRFGRLSDKDRLRAVVDMAGGVDQYGPAVLVIEFGDTLFPGAHAIVIDGLEEGNCAISGYYYTVRTYDINNDEAESVFGYQKGDPEYSYLYISEDFSKWTMNNQEYYPRSHGSQLSNKKILMCFRDESLVNLYKYREESLKAKMLVVPGGISGLVGSVDGNSFDLSSDGDIFCVPSIGDELEGPYKVFLPDDFITMELSADGEESLSATLRFEDNYVSVDAGADARITATSDLGRFELTGTGEASYEGDYALTAIDDGEDEAVITIEGTAEGDMILERSGDDYLLKSDGSHNSTISIEKEEGSEEFRNLSQSSIKITRNEDDGNIELFSDEDGDGTYETAIRAIEGLWATNVSDLVYTGQALTQPGLVVYHDDVLLEEGKDYTLKYKNNTAAYRIENPEYPSGTDIKKAPCVTVTGKGNYAGSTTVYFSILPAPISNAKVAEDLITVSANTKKGVSPVPSLTFAGKALKAGKDFEVKYYALDEWNDPKTGDPVPASTPIFTPGEYIIRIDAVEGSCFEGTHDSTVRLLITEPSESVSLSAKSVKAVGKIANQDYTGEEIDVSALFLGTEPAVKLVDGNYTLQYGEDYKILKYSGGVNPGNATVILTGTGKRNDINGHCYVGERKLQFKVVSSFNMKNAVITNVEKSYAYDGTALTIDSARISFPGYKNGEALVPGVDYDITYSGNQKVGKAKMTVTGKGMFFGSRTISFNITPYALSAASASITIDPESVDPQGSAYYKKGGSRPAVAVTDKNGRQLREGIDYTLKYSNNTKCFSDLSSAKAPKVTATGKGNYKGNVEARFAITKGDLSECTMAAADRADSSKKGGWVSVPKIIDTDGKALKAKTDYLASVTYAEDPEFTQILDTKSVLSLSAGEKSKTIYVRVQGAGNYEGSVLTGSYRIVEELLNKASAKFYYDGADGKSFEYTGRAIEPGKAGTLYEECIRVYNGNAELYNGVDYVITGYENNVAKGTAKMTIQGIGSYGGSKTITFRIGTRSFAGIAWIRKLISSLT